MIDAPDDSRRRFIIASAAVGGGLAIGFHPLAGIAVVRAGDNSGEVTPWIVIRPDDTVVVRMARSEMGQGALTGLAQLVAEELECDWNKVTWEYPSPAANAARNRIWGDFETGGSEHLGLSRIPAQGRRCGAHIARPRGGQRVESDGRGLHCRQGRHCT